MSPVTGPHTPEWGTYPCSHPAPLGGRPEGILGSRSCKTTAGLGIHCPTPAHSMARTKNIISKTRSCSLHQFHGCSCLVALTFSYRHHQLIKPPETDPGIKTRLQALQKLSTFITLARRELLLESRVPWCSQTSIKGLGMRKFHVSLKRRPW